MSLLLYIYLKKVTFWDFLVLICVFFSAMPRVFSIICFYRWGKGVLMLYLGKWDIVPKSLEKITYSNICSKLVYFFFSSPDPKGHVSYCHHLSSVCKLFKKSSPLKPLGQFKPSLAWIILRGFPLLFDDPADQTSWPPCL